MSKEIHVLQLYPRDMNIYGDFGNALVVRRRLERYGFTPVMYTYDPGDTFPAKVDIVIGGGGQDSGQSKIQDDLHAISDKLHSLADDNVPMVLICGLYQLFGHYFETYTGERIDGIGILDVTTIGKNKRLIGNIVARSERFGDIIGYENHSGQTFLGPQATPLAHVTKGAGNNTDDDTEGAMYKNIIGSYMHGSLLPKNPNIADFLIAEAVKNKFGESISKTLDDTLAAHARTHAKRRPR